MWLLKDLRCKEKAKDESVREIKTKMIILRDLYKERIKSATRQF